MFRGAPSDNSAAPPGAAEPMDIGGAAADVATAYAEPSDAALGAALSAFAPDAETLDDVRDTMLRYGKNIVLDALALFRVVHDTVEAQLAHTSAADNINKAVEACVRALVAALGTKTAHHGERETVGWTLLDLALRSDRVALFADTRRTPCLAQCMPRLLPFEIPRTAPLPLNAVTLVQFHTRDSTQSVAVEWPLAALLRAANMACHPANYICECPWYYALCRHAHEAVADALPPGVPTPEALDAAAPTLYPEPVVDDLVRLIAACDAEIIAALDRWIADFCVFHDFATALAQKFQP